MLLGGLLGACTSGGGEKPYHSPGTGLLGSPCQQTEDCASGLCVRVDDAGGICTAACTSDASCPIADNWACLSAEGGLKLCACRKLADHEVCADGSDNDCDGKVDDCRMCGGGPVQDDDPKNCGRCGNACDAKETCQGGACSCAAATPTRCAASCTDTTADSANCGGCGKSCGPERACKDGACECTDSTKPDFCGASCVSLASDANHCGKCDTVCKLAQVCSVGACACPSTDAPDFCDGVGCLSLQTDKLNCGKCGNVCGTGQVCNAGACGCPEGKTLCGDTCVNTQSDHEHCGACATQCGTLQACSGGTCGCQVFGFSVCGSECSNLQTDAANCGTCGKACGAGEVCAAGACLCQSGLHCGGTCEPQADANNCGACGVSCSAVQYCTGASCACQGFGLTKCGASCVDVSSDEANCGVCGKACPATQQCLNGSCGCAGYGQQFCVAQNACIDTLGDTQNCGACGKQCNPGEACSNGVCKCSGSTQKYCATANTCVDTQSNPQNCGACDKKCEATQVCSFGNCQCPSYYQTFCATANACVDLSSSNANCGACDKQCPAATHCAGACVCDDTSQTLCGSSCKNLLTDTQNCGSCGKTCGGNFTCSNGACKCPAATPGSEVRLTTTTDDEHYLSAAWDGVHVGLAYLSTANGTPNVRFSLLNADGSRASDVALTTLTNALPNPQTYSPNVAWSGTEYAVTWAQYSSYDNDGYSRAEVIFQRVGSDGQLIGSAVTITPHSLTMGYGKPVLAWSPNYGGYGLGYSKTTSNFSTPGVVFRRIGATATAPEAENVFGLNFDNPIFDAMAVAPDGTWALATGYSSYDLSLINADGSKTSATQHLGNLPFYRAGGPWIVHDGTTWITGYVSDVTATNRGIMINRGSTLNGPFAPFKTSDTPTGTLAMVDGTLAIGFGETAAVNGNYKFRMQRFALPTGTGSSMSDVHAAVDVSNSYTLQASTYSDQQLVATGTGSMLAIWADTRWGTSRELYARPIDLHACP
jgi:hypothetical protein